MPTRPPNTPEWVWPGSLVIAQGSGEIYQIEHMTFNTSGEVSFILSRYVFAGAPTNVPSIHDFESTPVVSSIVVRSLDTLLTMYVPHPLQLATAALHPEPTPEVMGPTMMGDPVPTIQGQSSLIHGLGLRTGTGGAVSFTPGSETPYPPNAFLRIEHPEATPMVSPAVYPHVNQEEISPSPPVEDDLQVLRPTTPLRGFRLTTPSNMARTFYLDGVRIHIKGHSVYVCLPDETWHEIQMQPVDRDPTQRQPATTAWDVLRENNDESD